MKGSKIFKLNFFDFIKGLIIAILTPVIVYLQSYFSNGNLNIDIKSLFAVGLSGLLAYLIKNFFSNND